MEQHPDINFFVGAIDTEVDRDGMILPGCGDAGDRMFGRPCRQHLQGDKAVPSLGSALSERDSKDVQDDVLSNRSTNDREVHVDDASIKKRKTN